MTAVHDFEVLVLRAPAISGDFEYRVATLPDDKARQWRARFATQPASELATDVDRDFCGPMTLPQIMEHLDTRDFQVITFGDTGKHAAPSV